MFVEIVDEHDPGDGTRSHRDVIAIMKVANGTYGASRRWSPFGAGNRRKKARPRLHFASTAGCQIVSKIDFEAQSESVGSA